MTSYCVHARDEEIARPHRVQAETPLDAALLYAERWLGSAPHDAVTLLVEDEDAGREHCLRLNLDSGEVRPCG